MSLAGIQLPSTKNLQQKELNSPVPLNAGHTLGQSFTATMYRFSRVGGQFPTWSNKLSAVKMTLYAGTPEKGLTEIASHAVDPVQDNGWAYLDVPDQPAGSYYLELSHTSGTPGWWSHLGDTTVHVGGLASWNLKLTGAQLAMSYDVQWQDTSRPDPGLTFNTSWVSDGYSVDYADGILFNRFFADEGAYLPAEQLKRRKEWTAPMAGKKMITATGSGPYDLQITGTDPILDGPCRRGR